MDKLKPENELNDNEEKQSNKKRGYKILMKTLIWIGCFIVYCIVNTLIAALTGFMLGYGITIFVLFFGAKKLCDKWEENYIKRQNSVDQEQNNKETSIKDFSGNLKQENPQNKSEEVFREQTDEVSVATIPVSSELDYRNAKKAARQEFKNKKKDLKDSYPKQKENKFKIATIVLSVLLAGATVVNVAQFVYYEEESALWLLEKTELNEQIDLLETKYYELAADEEVASEHQSILLKKIGFYNRGDSQYHKFTCNEFFINKEYWAHNREYCEWLGYSAHSCIYEDDEKKWSIDDVDLSKYEIIF